MVPSDGKSTKDSDGPTNGYDVDLLQDLNKVLKVLLANVLNSKIVNDKREGDVLMACFQREGVRATGL